MDNPSPISFNIPPEVDSEWAKKRSKSSSARTKAIALLYIQKTGEINGQGTNEWMADFYEVSTFQIEKCLRSYLSDFKKQGLEIPRVRGKRSLPHAKWSGKAMVFLGLLLLDSEVAQAYRNLFTVVFNLSVKYRSLQNPPAEVTKRKKARNSPRG